MCIQVLRWHLAMLFRPLQKILSARNAGLQLLCKRLPNEWLAVCINFNTCFFELVLSNFHQGDFDLSTGVTRCDVVPWINKKLFELLISKEGCTHRECLWFCRAWQLQSNLSSRPGPRSLTFPWQNSFSPTVTLVTVVWVNYAHKFDYRLAGSIIDELFLQQTFELIDCTCPVALNVSVKTYDWYQHFIFNVKTHASTAFRYSERSSIEYFDWFRSKNCLIDFTWAYSDGSLGTQS